MQLTIKQSLTILRSELTKRGFIYSTPAYNEQYFTAVKLTIKDGWYKEVYIAFHWEQPNKEAQGKNRVTDHELALKKIEVMRWYTKDFLNDPTYYVGLLENMGIEKKPKLKSNKYYGKTNTRNSINFSG